LKFELFTAKTIKQCTTDLQARFDEKESKSRAPISGYVNKSGEFMLVTETKVLILLRVTRMKGTLEKTKDNTIIRGYVSDGVPPSKVGIIMAALGFTAFILFANQQAVFAIIIAITMLFAYITLIGDHTNSTYLIKELKRITGAKDKPVTTSTPLSSSSSAKPAPKPAPKANTPFPKTDANRKASAPNKPTSKSAPPRNAVKPTR
jgi:hypothetical protein